MPNDANPPPLASYDAKLARDIAGRAAIADANQRERDARRADYDAAMCDMPITLALRALRQPLPPTANNAWRHTPRVHKDTRMTTGPNAWERQDDHPRAHLRPDTSCHHPLVKCHHKW